MAVVEEHNFVACCMAKVDSFDIVVVIEAFESVAKGTGREHLVRLVEVDS